MKEETEINVETATCETPEESAQADSGIQTEKKAQPIWTKIKYLASRWFIQAFTGMAYGLFATLIAGTILEQIGVLIGDNAVGNLIVTVAKVAKTAMGAGIGIGIAHSLKCDRLTMFTCAACGLVGAFAKGWLTDFSLVIALGSPGNPIGAYLTAIISAEICTLYAGKTRFDIILIPLGSLIITALTAITICPPATWLITQLSTGIAIATIWSPFIMGVVISVVMGVLLTMPTSSAAMWVAIVALATEASDEGLLIAGGAAVVGCSCQMVGFAAMSFKENRFAGLIAQGFGTSMLQIPNIMKNGRIFLPPIVASAICGPLATCVFNLKCGTGAGMGTSGLVGVIDCFTTSIGAGEPWWSVTLGVILLMFILPAAISIGVCELERKIGWIKEKDMLLEL